MGLFDQVLNAINNPSQQASTDGLSQILGTVQQLATQKGIDPAIAQTVTSVVGQHLRSSLKQQQATAGTEQIERMVNQYSGTSASSEAVRAIFSPAEQQQIAQEAAQKTGLNTDTIQAMLPSLIPVVLNLLQSGASQSGSQGSTNSVLNAFLDSDADGDVDVGDALSLASRFLNR